MPQQFLTPSRRTGAAYELLVAYRFMSAGRVPSWPLVPMAYDLLLDCGDSLQRIQVKAAPRRKDCYHCHLTKRRKGGDSPIHIASVDYICIVCEVNQIYVIPSVALRSPTDPAILCKRLQIYPTGERLKGYLNAFAIGTGAGWGDGNSQPTMDVPALKVPWFPAQQVPHSKAQRKAHVRLTMNQINTLKQELGPRPTPQAVLAAARRYNITGSTVRNYLRNARADLVPLLPEGPPPDTLSDDAL